jgi:ectoine hydroxylase-related dioxygenase (phytanoyl-CoA dioxygenase family)
MDEWPEIPGKWMKYFEQTLCPNGSRILSRIENFCQYNPELDYFLTGTKLLGATSQLFGEPSILYKEKINYKMPGGSGFTPHQDVAAGWWMYGGSYHINALIAIDEATKQNGCLQVALMQHTRGMLSVPWTEISPEVEASMAFVDVEMRPGDIAFFDSFVPHRSQPNHSERYKQHSQ